ncbi:peptidase associated/transthyretin-like domain-containing protein [Pontibacter arcticus]|uniref:CarboxypepD_reg-like domain-containing protein n=1 Tax=Pontibacter arcticus TaxID=2080288 RepID=A0A364RDC0_9BACT|nr:hypothetical protein [Pontibacter arcticus]RAU82156.1 hypothetical protein DP923_10135 [Pontibacter arcticus]
MRPALLPCIVFFFFLWIALPVAAQQATTIRGTILLPDKKTPVAGAAITNLKINQTILSDQAGVFEIRATLQDSLLIRAVGYKALFYVVTNNAAPILLLEPGSVKLTEVEVRSKPEPVKAVSTQIKRPGYDPASEPPPPPPAPLPSVIWNPVSAFSKETQQKKKLMKLKKEQAKDQAEQEKENYNRFFKDNTGYQ